MGVERSGHPLIFLFGTLEGSAGGYQADACFLAENYSRVLRNTGGEMVVLLEEIFSGIFFAQGCPKCDL